MSLTAETFRPYRRLAERIIALALHDAVAGSHAEGASARAFLADSTMLRLWCQVANLDVRCVTARAATLRSVR
jgi:hypothetical protein